MATALSNAPGAQRSGGIQKALYAVFKISPFAIATVEMTISELTGQ